MTGIVLSGGESRRMGGRDKALLEIAGIPLIEHVLRALRMVAGRILIVSKSPEAYARFGAELAADDGDKRGSLVGIYSGLLKSQEEYNIVVACDMPFLDSRLLSYMAGIAEGHDITVPKRGELIEPLHAIYRRSLLPVLEDCIRRDQRKIRDLFAGRRVRFVGQEEIDRFDPAGRSFININTPGEYEEAACSDLECRN